MSQHDEVERFLQSAIMDESFNEALSATLLDLCAIENTPNADIPTMRARENDVFEIIVKVLNGIDLRTTIEKREISAALIRQDPSFTPPYYTTDRDPYAGRSNLTCIVTPAAEDVAPLTTPSPVAAAVAVNAHIDTVLPHVPPRRDEDRISGRGSCDDKGNIVVMIAALRLLSQVQARFGISPQREITLMFVTDEESGGNGSLALAMDQELRKHYDELIVLECCDNQIYPANRGALWYRVEIPAGLAGSQLGIAAELVVALEQMGARLYGESDHPLFPDRPVQTCHGMWGPWGEHPSRVCGFVEFEISTSLPEKVLDSAIAIGVQDYIAVHGDKTIPTGGRAARVKHHWIKSQSQTGYQISVYGSTGHMAALREHDGALTKAAAIIAAVTAADPRADFRLCGHDHNGTLVIEGGQSFLPTHSIEAVKQRIEAACRPVFARHGYNPDHVEKLVTTNKLHNAAFCSDPQAPLFRRARALAEAFGLPQEQKVKGWGASCDARLFAERYSGLPVITMGAGNLQNAHADTESIGIDEIRRNAGLLALLLLERTGAFRI